ncbi:hypothetical protein CDAR_29301 [Caerostris darwini]|uniref:Uncharacterized protein n=1 Tax=Caerostris darwini TaxID=1538125 RepID=A0AAV4RWG4_9ARAC|nr:hypothetical protein CDAR_29301 [Caerostris darwini]
MTNPTQLLPLVFHFPKLRSINLGGEAFARATVEKKDRQVDANWLTGVLVYSRDTEGYFMQIISVSVPLMGLSTTESLQIEIGVPKNPHRQTRDDSSIGFNYVDNYLI